MKAAVAALALTTLLVPSAYAATCADVEVMVALAANGPVDQKIVGTLCYAPPLAGKVVQVLLSGAAYGRIYWDFPLRPEQYSYVRALTAAGYATLAVDRIGIGASAHPPALDVTVSSSAFVIHQIVQALRDGSLANVAFSTVVLVGHSLGSGVATVEASRYGDVDGVILTGFLHTFGPNFFTVPATFYPAQLDDRFKNENLPLGYLTTAPNSRGLLFYWPPNAEADVVALDEATKETLTIGEGIEFPGVVVSRDIPGSIHVPVLVAVGQYDTIWCVSPVCPEALLEPTYYPADADVEVRVIPGAGHDLNLELSAATWFATAGSWLDDHFGQ